MQSHAPCRPRVRYVEGLFAIDWMLRLGKVRCEAGRVPDRSGEKAEENSKWKCDRCAEVRPKGGVGFGVRLIRNICAPPIVKKWPQFGSNFITHWLLGP